VNHRRTLKVKLEEVNSTFENQDETLEEAKPSQSLPVECLFEKIMASLNPFSQFMIREMQANDGSSQVKHWELDEAIFRTRGAQTEVNKDFLHKTSSEMFVIYKYTQDPRMRIKSHKYLPHTAADTEEEKSSPLFVECRTLLPQEETLLFENSILNELSAKDAELALQEHVK